MICLLAKMAQLTKLLKSYIACWMLFTMIMLSQPFNCRSFNLYLLFTLKSVNDSCLMPTQQFFSYTMVIFALNCIIHKFRKKNMVSWKKKLKNFWDLFYVFQCIFININILLVVKLFNNWSIVFNATFNNI